MAEKRSEVEIVLRAIDQITAPFRSGKRSADDLAAGTETADRALRKFSQEAAGVGPGLEGLSLSADKAASAIQGIAAAVGAAAVIRGLVEVVQDSVRSFADFDLGLAQVGAVSRATSDEMEVLSDTALRLAEQTKFSAKEVVSSYYELSSAGLSVSEQLESIGGVLDFAAAGNIELADSATAATVAMNAFSLGAGGVTHAVDAMTLATTKSALKAGEFAQIMADGGGMADLAGQSLESFIAAAGALRDVGISASSAGTAIKTALQQGIINPSPKAQQAIDNLHMSFRDGEGRIKQWADLIAELERGTANLTEEERQLAISTIFGSEGISAITASLKKGSSELRDFTTELNSVNGVAKSIADTMMDRLDGALKQLQSTLESTGINIGKDWAGPVGEMVQYATELIGVFNNLDDATRRTVLILGAGAGLTGAATLATGALAGLATVFASFGTAALAVAGPVAGVGLAITAVIAVAQQLGEALVEADRYVGLAGSMSQHQIQVVEAAVRSGGGALEQFETQISTARARIQELGTTEREVQRLGEAFETLTQKSERTADEDQRRQEILNRLKQLIPTLNANYADEASALDKVRAAVEETTRAKKEQVAAELADIVRARRAQRESLADLIEQEKEKKRLSEEERRRNEERLKQHEQFLKSVGREDKAGVDEERVQVQARAVDARIATAEHAIRSYEEQIGRLDTTLDRIAQGGLSTEEMIEVLLGGDLEGAQRKAEAAGDAVVDAVAGIAKNAVAAWEKHLQNEISLAPTHEAMEEAEAALRGFLADQVAAFQEGGAEGATAFLKEIEGRINELKTERGAKFLDAESAAAEAKNAFAKMEEEQRAALDSMGLSEEKFYKQVSENNAKLLKQGRLDVDGYLDGLDAMLSEEEIQTAERGTLYEWLQGQREKAISAALSSNRDMLRAEAMDEESFVDKQVALINRSQMAEQEKLLAIKQVYADEAAIRQKHFSEWQQQEERRIETGGQSYDGLLAGINAFIAAREWETDEEKRLLNDLLAYRQQVEGKIRDQGAATAEHQLRMNEISLSDYRDYLQKVLDEGNLAIPQQEQIQEKLFELNKQIKFEEPLNRASSAADLFLAKLENLASAQEAASGIKDWSRVREIEENQLQYYERAVQMARQELAFKMAAAEAEKDPATKNALLQDVLAAENELQKVEQQFGKFVEGKGTHFTSVFRSVFDETENMLAPIQEQWEAMVSLPTEEAGSALLSASNEARRILDEVGNEKDIISSALREIQKTEQQNYDRLVEQLGNLTREVQGAARMNERTAERIRDMSDHIDQQIRISIGTVKVVEQVNQMIRQEISKILI